MVHTNGMELGKIKESLDWRGSRSTRGINSCTSQKDTHPIRLVSGNRSYQARTEDLKTNNLQPPLGS